MTQAIPKQVTFALFCHFGKIQRIHVVTAYEKSRFHPGLTKEGYSIFVRGSACPSISIVSSVEGKWTMDLATTVC